MKKNLKFFTVHIFESKKIFRNFFIITFIFFMLYNSVMTINAMETIDDIVSEEFSVFEKYNKDIAYAVFWSKKLDNELLIYVDNSVLQLVGIPYEKELIENFVSNLKESISIDEVNVFVHREGFYIKDNIPTGLK
ncbi:MAG: hypothetical protein ACK5LY_08930 [Lachnospirales bacterium]